MAESTKPKKPRESDLVRLTRENAKKDWLDRFTGPVLLVDANVGSPLVQHMLKRVFDITGRNAHFIQVFGAILLANQGKVVEECVEHVMNTVKNARKDFENKTKQLEAVVQDADIKELVVFNSPMTTKVKIISPIQREFLRALQDADRLMQLIDTLYLEGQIPDIERSKFQREIKWKLRNIATSARNMFNHIRKRIDGKNQDAVAKEAGLELPAENTDEMKDDGEVVEIATAKTSGRKKAVPKEKAATPETSSIPSSVDVHASEPAAAAGG